jgi:hypothetical protein
MARTGLNLALAFVVCLTATSLLVAQPTDSIAMDPPGGCTACVEECGNTEQWACINQCYGTTHSVPDSCTFSILPCLGYPGHYRTSCVM